ncbi:putative membrane protein [Labedella gwakjiensis]|uniref:Putative membrane protein n=1 Tax=Labedella gwakjiensis TaxID=390269 RepID=A0A2P8GX58_9MICO|nr:YhgE/Pip domain-containing protein [Labedella gwakjiensis]PSL38541.1 putative membrane protein [Labedella gwakjiensis]RUQ86949.1 YhgE/Pip domain-containing protein [Labedella gwakjiensis]
MSTPVSILERAGSHRRIGWLGILGIILVPLVVAGILVWALWNPEERLPQVTAAIVNNDEPVEIDGQQVPLGRQLSAGLVGNDDTNYTWVITDEDDAESGLADGSYTAVVTIPENFSAAATSVGGDAADAEQATIDVSTSDRSRLVDDALTATITSTAASLTGTELTTSYLENIYVGFNTLGDQLGEAADGAQQSADGADQLASGADDLATGAGELATGADTLETGAKSLASGASDLAGGASDLDTGVQGLAGGLTELDEKTAAFPTQTQADQLVAGVDQLASGTSAAVTALQGQNAALAALAQECFTSGASVDYCTRLATAAGTVDAIVEGNGTADLPGLTPLVTGTQDLADQVGPLASGLPALKSGISQLASGGTQLASGSSQLSAGASQLSSGVAQYATGVSQFSDGVTQLADGTTTLADGAGSLADGVGQLADGLDTAVESIPSYSESDRENLATVVADPVASEGGGIDFGSKGAPFYAVLALWIGALGSFVLLRAVPTTLVGSTRSSIALVLRSFAPAAIVGALQGVLVAGVLQLQLSFGVAEWFGFAALLALTGVAFAAVTQSLIAVFGGTGRFLSMIIAIVTLATGIVSTVPGVLDAVFGFLPVSPAQEAIRGLVEGTGGLAPAVVALILWTLGALVVSTIRVATERTVPARRFARTPTTA